MENNPLAQVQLFSGLSDNVLEKIYGILQERRIAGGQVLFNMGDPGDELILVKTGKIAIYTPEDGKPGSGKPIRVFEPGQALGDMALIDRKPRSASARAEGDSTILSLDGNTFRSLIFDYPEIASNALSGLSDRVRYTTDFLNQVRIWVNRISAGNYSAGQFNQEMEEWKKVNATSNTQNDKSLISLAAEFAEMVMQVKKREDALQEQIEQLKIEIDQAKRKEEVQQILGSDYYQSLRDRVKRMRDAARESDDEG